jgi:bla regulator protein blaR1
VAKRILHPSQRLFLAVFISLIAGAPIRGQILHATGPLPSFEVATIKPVQPRPVPPPPPPGANDNRPPPPRMFGIGKLGGQRTDRVHMNSSADLLILFAYNLPFGSERTRIVGGPDWLGSTQYEIQAKIDDALFAAMQKMTPDQQREQVDLMEQSLLADRFKLKVHFETREMPVYALVVAKGGPKLTPATDGETSSISSFHSEIDAKAVALDDFAQSSLWTPVGGRLVVNQTGLKGTYDFTLNWSQDQTAAPDAGQESVPTLSPMFNAIQQQLGLKLVPSKAPVEVIVIDHIERPSEN